MTRATRGQTAAAAAIDRAAIDRIEWAKVDMTQDGDRQGGESSNRKEIAGQLVDSG
jgi:hypothetical protein